MCAWGGATLQRLPLGAALDRVRAGLRAYTTALGAGARYHDTITVTYLLLIAERQSRTPTLEWPAFAARWPELFARTPSLLTRYYHDATLQSPAAVAGFVMPDRLAAWPVDPG